MSEMLKSVAVGVNGRGPYLAARRLRATIKLVQKTLSPPHIIAFHRYRESRAETKMWLLVHRQCGALSPITQLVAGVITTKDLRSANSCTLVHPWYDPLQVVGKLPDAFPEEAATAFCNHGHLVQTHAGADFVLIEEGNSLFRRYLRGGLRQALMQLAVGNTVVLDTTKGWSHSL